MGEATWSRPIDVYPSPDATAPRRADARRVASAGLADLAARQAEAIAALDRALEARLGELDRAFAVRRSGLESLVAESEGHVGELVDSAVSELRRSGSGERRVLHEAVAAELAGVEEQAVAYRRQLHEMAAHQQAELRALADRVAELVHRVEEMEGALERLGAGRDRPGDAPRP